MSFAPLRRWALSLPAAAAEVKWQSNWVASVGGRMFFVGSPEPGAWNAVGFKVDEHRFLELCGLPGLAPAPYLARAHWIQVTRSDALPLPALKTLIARSHALVAARLTRRVRVELGLAALAAQTAATPNEPVKPIRP